ncbi:ComF family protein [Pseudodesulfovibrio indicus]|uniref:ComF family protein n=1 Tax=Pseudodesulfovibrio indicus TaxID=1716143 RepID=A0A126QL92_9BACT|nr:ComF family protein [Pseudodesulfovibrio indicus]AMK10820.1 phosphoribosyltransferase [Pseudodesulfovibrio indicus]TDT91813.1 ComF family protein [Pseudodesulfovibrio indicus]
MLRRFAPLARRLGLTAARCPVCGTVMADRTRPLCARCAVELPLRTGGYCPSCGEMYGREADPPTRCAECRLTPPPWDGLYLHGRYAGLLRDLILGFKFGNSYGRARLLADLGALAYGSGRGLPPDLVVPVPLHTRRLLWRGFNQSLEIARGVAGRLSVPLSTEALTRTRNTPPQTRLGVKERQANIKGAIAARPDLVRGRRVLLVDDVYTTGSTLRECARTLRRAGCEGVEVLVLARTQREPD